MKTATRVSLPFSAGAEQGLGGEGTMAQRPAFTPHPRWPSGSPPLMSVRAPPLHTCSSDTPLAHPSRVSRDCPRSAPLPPLCHLHHCLNSSHLDDCQAAQQASRRRLSLSHAGPSPPGLPCACHCPPPVHRMSVPWHWAWARTVPPRRGHAPLLHPPASPSHLAGPRSAPCAVGTSFPTAPRLLCSPFRPSLCVLSSAGRVTLVKPQRACWVRQGRSPGSTAMKANQCPQLCSFFGSPCPKGAYIVLLSWPQSSLWTSFGGGEGTVVPDNALFFV